VTEIATRLKNKTKIILSVRLAWPSWYDVDYAPSGLGSEMLFRCGFGPTPWRSRPFRADDHYRLWVSVETGVVWNPTPEKTMTLRFTSIIHLSFGSKARRLEAYAHAGHTYGCTKVIALKGQRPLPLGEAQSIMML